MRFRLGRPCRIGGPNYLSERTISSPERNMALESEQRIVQNLPEDEPDTHHRFLHAQEEQIQRRVAELVDGYNRLEESLQRMSRKY